MRSRMLKQRGQKIGRTVLVSCGGGVNHVTKSPPWCHKIGKNPQFDGIDLSVMSLRQKRLLNDLSAQQEQSVTLNFDEPFIPPLVLSSLNRPQR